MIFFNSKVKTGFGAYSQYRQSPILGIRFVYLSILREIKNWEQKFAIEAHLRLRIPQIIENLCFVFDIKGILFSAKNKGQSTQTYPDQNNIDCAVYEIGISHERNATDNH